MTAFSRFRRPPAGAHAAWARGEDPFAGDAISGDAATVAVAALEPEDRPLGSPAGAPAPVVHAPRPSFTPRASGPQTRVDLVMIAADDFDPLSRAIRIPLTTPAVIGDSIPVPPPGSGMALGRGWSRYLAAARLDDPNRDARDSRRAEALHAQHEQGLGRNAAELAGVARHFREQVTAAAEQVCAAMGRPDLAGPLLRRVEQFNAQARLQDRGAA